MHACELTKCSKQWWTLINTRYVYIYIYNTHGFIAINYLLIFSIFNLIFKSTEYKELLESPYSPTLIWVKRNCDLCVLNDN